MCWTKPTAVCTVRRPSARKGAPIHTPIPQIIAMLQEGRLDEAGRTLFENNPLTTVCSLVCNHETSARATVCWAKGSARAFFRH